MDKKIWKFLVSVAVALAAIIIVYFYGPENIVNQLGTQNSYILLFISGAIIGLSAVSSSSFYIFVGTLALAGSNPILIGIFGGVGLAVGDSIFYLVGIHGYRSLSGNVKRLITNISEWLKKQKDYFIWLIIYVYSAFTPFPSDLLMLSLGIADYSYKKAIIPIVLGNITLIFLIALLIS